MKTDVQNIKPSVWLMIFGVLTIVSGVYVWFNPDTALLAVALYLGMVFLFGGAAYLSAFFTMKSGGLLALGLIDLIVGFILVAYLGLTAASMPIFLAVWILCVSVVQIAYGFDIKSWGVRAWKWSVVSGILGLVFGFLILTHPIVGVFTISVLLGLYMILYGSFCVGEYWALRSLFKQV